jgi:hypothetical protein
MIYLYNSIGILSAIIIATGEKKRKNERRDKN